MNTKLIFDQVTQEANTSLTDKYDLEVLEEGTVTDADLKALKNIREKKGSMAVGTPEAEYPLSLYDNEVAQFIVKKYIKNESISSALDGLEKIKEFFGHSDAIYPLKRELERTISAILKETLSKIDYEKLRRFV